MAETATMESDESDRGGIFHRVRPRRVWLGVVAFTTASFLLHGAGFYLFQVVYPSPSRMEPRRDSIQVMDGADPAVRSVLQRIRDRTIYLLPASHDSGVRRTLDEAEVRFTSSFQRAEMPLLPPRYEWNMPAPLDPPESDLDDVAEHSSGPLVTLGGGLEDRSVAPWSILSDYLRRMESLPAVRAEVEVDRDGQVTVGEVDSEPEEIDGARLVPVIESTLRFTPAEAPVSGWIEVKGGG